MKKSRLCLIYIIISLFCTLTAYGKDSQKNSSKLDSIFQQHLEWESRGVVKEYRLIVEINKNNSFVEVLNITTKNTFCDVSLKPGSYRYTVYFYNVLGQMAFKTEYKSFEILEAQKPEVKKSLVESVYKQEENFSGELCITVSDVSSSTKFSLLQTGKKEKVYEATKVRIDGEKVYLTFPEDAFTSGNYKILITNPGGLTATTGVIRIREKKDLFFDAGIGYCPEFVLYDDFVKEYFKSSFIPMNFYADGSICVELENIGRLGAGLIVSSSPVWKKFDNCTLICGITSVCANVVYTREIFSIQEIPFFVEAFAGAGLNILGNLHYKYSDKRDADSITSILPCFDAGLSLKALVTEKIYVKAGSSFLAAQDFGLSDYDIGSLKIFAGAGVEL